MESQAGEAAAPPAADDAKPAAFSLYSDVETSESDGEQHADHALHAQAHEMAEVTPELLADVVKQVEFYFSDANLPTDKKLLKHIRKDSQGFVPVKMFSNFRKIRALTKEVDVIAMALRDSEGLVLSADSRHVRRAAPVPEYNISDIQRRILVVEDLAVGNTIDSMSEMFAEYGTIKVVRICSKENKGKLPGWMTAGCLQTSQQCAFIEYASEAEAVHAAAAVHPPEDRRARFKINLLVSLQQSLPASLSSWRDEAPRSRGGAGGAGSNRASRDASPLGARLLGHSRLQQSPGGHRPLGRSSVEHPAAGGGGVARLALDRRSLDPTHGQRPAGASAGAADSSSVWGHEGFHPSDASRALHKRPSQERQSGGGRVSHDSPARGKAAPAEPRSPPRQQVQSWHPAEPLVSAPSLSDGMVAEAKPHAAAAAVAAAYTPPSRRPLDAAHAAAETGLVELLPAAQLSVVSSPDAGEARQGGASQDGGAGGGSVPIPVPAVSVRSYASAAATGLGSGACSPLLSPASPHRKQPGSKLQAPPGFPAAGGAKPPSSPSRGVAAAAAGKLTTAAALNAMLADVMAVAELRQKEMDAAAAAGTPDAAATGGAAPSPFSGCSAPPDAAAAAAAAPPPQRPTSRSAQPSRGGSRGASPQPSALEVDNLIHKILVSPTNRSGNNSSSGVDAAAASPSGAAAAAAGGQARSGGPSRAGSEASDPAAVDCLISKILSDMPAGQHPPAVDADAGLREARRSAGGGSEEEPVDIHSSPATSLGRQLSVVPEGNEFARVSSAQLDGLLLPGGMGVSGMERELSLVIKGEGVPLAALREAAVGSWSLAEAESVTLAAFAASPLLPTAALAIPMSKPPLPGSSGRGAASSARARVGEYLGASSSSGEEGEEGGAEGKGGRRRRSRRSRRKSAVMGSPEAGGEGMAAAATALRDAGGRDSSGRDGGRDAPRQRRASSGSGAQRRMSDGAAAAAAGEGRKESGSGAAGEAKAGKKKKDYASWAAATPEYRAEAAAKYVAGGGSVGGAKCQTSPPLHLRRTTSPAPSPPRGRRPSDGSAPGHLHGGHGEAHGHGALTSRGPDGSRGFSVGRGKPLAPPPPL